MATTDDGNRAGGKPGDRRGDRGAEAARKARLAEELRANLLRRKRQARARRAGEADQRPEGLGPSEGEPEA